jgi:predicted dienelactone hydrolase
MPVASAAGPGDRNSTNVFDADPRGPHRTGTFEELWVDAGQEETTTSDPHDKRRLMVQLWYPATFEGDPPRAPYVLRRELYAPNDEARWLDELKDVRTTSVLNAAVASGSGPFPVLLYNPGSGYPHFTGTAQTEFLASHGYVVVAIGHTGLSGIERFPDGYAYRPDVYDMLAADPRDEGLSRAEQLLSKVRNASEKRLPILMRDIHFVLDRLQSLNSTSGSRFHGRLDLDRIGSFGWSAGGSLSIQAGRDEPRIKAAVNLDGNLYTTVQETGTSRPILMMHQEGSPWAQPEAVDAAERERLALHGALMWQLYARTGAKADWYDVTLKRAQHGNFADLALFDPADPAFIHPRLAHDIVNRYTLEFFDRYLRSAVKTPLLSGDQSYPESEVQLLTNARARTR